MQTSFEKNYSFFRKENIGNKNNTEKLINTATSNDDFPCPTRILEQISSLSYNK